MNRLITGLFVTFSLIFVTSLTQASQVPTPIAKAAAVPTETITVSWPQANQSDHIDHTFTAAVTGMPVNQYYLFWQVDNGQYVMMPNTSDNTAKQTVINFSSWYWRGNGPYTVNFIAQDLRAQEFSRRTVSFYREWTPNGAIWKASESNFFVSSVASIGKPVPKAAPTPSSISTPVATAHTPAATAPTPLAPVTHALTTQPVTGKIFYAAPNTLTDYVNTLSAGTQSYQQLKQAAQTPQAVWLGEWTPNVESYVKNIVDKASQTNSIASFVLYNIPYRDCGSYSAGGLPASQYTNWVEQVARGIGNRQTLIVLEPDALPGANCLSESARNERYGLVKSAVAILKQKSAADVYIDVGHPNWLNADDAAARLKMSGIELANGFSTNVSNFASTDANIAYGNEISSKVGGKHYIIDTSRNGTPALQDNNWCNPNGKKFGTPSTFSTGQALVDAYLWIKHPGESDGTCNGGPSAGALWVDYLMKLF